MNIKKIVAGVLACCVVGGVMPTFENITSNTVITANAETYEQLTYKNYGDYIEISDCNESATEVVIPAEIEGLPVKSIGDGAFYMCPVLTSITIPESVTNIGDNTFSWCSNLTSVTIPESVTSIGDSAFYRCSGLTSVTIPESVTSIGKSAFYRCSGLTSVTIPESVTSIGDDAFYGCSGLTSVTIPESVANIGNSAFKDCSGLTSVTIPESITSIGNYVFSDCSGLTSITIPESVTSIGNGAFYGCSSLTSVTIPESVTIIGSGAFLLCTGLKSIKILNPECDIYNASGTINNTTTIYGYDNSTAQAYAEKYGYKFESLGEAPAVKQPDVDILGDANCDGAVNIADATAIVQHLGNQDKYGLSEKGLINADCCNVGDGVTGLDALAIQKLEAGMIDSLPDTN